MKTILFLSVLFCAITLPALGDLTDTDLNRIRSIINEEIKKESVTTNQKIDALGARIQSVAEDVAWVKGKFESVDKQFDCVGEQIMHGTYVTYGLIALIVAAIAIPQMLIAWRSGQNSTSEKQVEMLIQEIETLKQQIEILKQQRIVNP